MALNFQKTPVPPPTDVAQMQATVAETMASVGVTDVQFAEPLAEMPPPKKAKAKKPKVQPLAEDVEIAAEPMHVPAVESAPMTEVEAMTEEFLALHRLFVLYDMKTVIKRMDDLKKALQTIANETMDAKKPATFTCKDGSLTFSERSKVAEVLNPMALVTALNEKFGPEVAFSVVEIALTPLRKILTEQELKKHLVDVPGFRTLKVVEDKA